MSHSVAEAADAARGPGVIASAGARWARAAVLRRLEALADGRLRLVESAAGGERRVFGRAAGDLEEAHLEVHDPRFYSRVALGGTIGAGESYMAGEWASADLTTLVRLLVRNRAVMLELEGGWARLASLGHRLFHRLRANHRRGSRRNVEAHYDLGNDFYALFLDPTMTYSCAYFERGDESLEEASLAKLERICRKLELGSDDHVLEIGTGWGGFAVYAAERYGCRVTTTTLSPAQRAYVLERVRRAGLEGRVTVLGRDYRDLWGRYDKLVSIEMIEAVGLDHLDTFFAKCGELLRPEGLMVLQGITIADRYFEAARRSVDFIQRYVFPGSALPSVAALTAAVARSSPLTPVHLEDIGTHYARTLALWRERFLERLDEVRRQGFSERFIRFWCFYLCYCEGGFLERATGDVQLVLAGPRHLARL